MRTLSLDLAAQRFLFTGEHPRHSLAYFMGDRTAGLWAAGGSECLALWIEEHPGTRPWAWWELKSPRCQSSDLPARVGVGYGDWFFRKTSAPRRRVGGIGTPVYEVLNYFPAFRRGVPDRWVDRCDVELYNGCARDIHGNVIMPGVFKDGAFLGLAPSETDPPMYESEAAYLRRHGLLMPGEEQQITDVDFEPVSYDEIYVPFGERDDDIADDSVGRMEHV